MCVCACVCVVCMCVCWQRSELQHYRYHHYWLSLIICDLGAIFHTVVPISYPCRHLAQSIDMKDKHIDEALREFQTLFLMPVSFTLCVVECMYLCMHTCAWVCGVCACVCVCVWCGLFVHLCFGSLLSLIQIVCSGALVVLERRR